MRNKLLLPCHRSAADGPLHLASCCGHDTLFSTETAFHSPSSICNKPPRTSTQPPQINPGNIADRATIANRPPPSSRGRHSAAKASVATSEVATIAIKAQRLETVRQRTKKVRSYILDIEIWSFWYDDVLLLTNLRTRGCYT